MNCARAISMSLRHVTHHLVALDKTSAFKPSNKMRIRIVKNCKFYVSSFRDPFMYSTDLFLFEQTRLSKG